MNSVNKLMRRGANVELENEASVSPSDAARIGGHMEVAIKLDEGTSKIATSKTTPFFSNGAPGRSSRPKSPQSNQAASSSATIGPIKPTGVS
jgi:hypothetical protein